MPRIWQGLRTGYPRAIARRLLGRLTASFNNAHALKQSDQSPASSERTSSIRMSLLLSVHAFKVVRVAGLTLWAGAVCLSLAAGFQFIHVSQGNVWMRPPYVFFFPVCAIFIVFGALSWLAIAYGRSIVSRSTDPEFVGILTVALDHPDKETREIAEVSLKRALLKLDAVTATSIDEVVWDRLCRFIAHDTSMSNLDLGLAIIDSLEIAGWAPAIPVFEQLSHSTTTPIEGAALMRRATLKLPSLRVRAREASERRTLLRPSEHDEFSDGKLLRPANGHRSPVATDGLLRPVEIQEDSRVSDSDAAQ
jgi:hypothetical protein